jgi:nucleoside-diphosphate-sugar epimerase
LEQSRLIERSTHEPETPNSTLETALRILVTGGSGYLGTHVRRYFEAEDFSRRSHLDILSPLDAARVGAYDVVIHLAAHLSKNPAEAENCFRTNVEGTLNLLREMQNGATFIFASTKDVYGPHANDFGEVPETCPTGYVNQGALEWSKLVAEKYVEFHAAQGGFRSCIFRLSNVYARPSEGNDNGLVTHYVESVKRGWPIRLPVEGKPVRDILHVDDFSRACRAFIDSTINHGLYNLGGGRDNAVSLREIVDKVGEMIQREPVFDEANPLPVPVPLNYISDLSRIQAELKWRPTIGVDEGLRSLL